MTLSAVLSVFSSFLYFREKIKTFIVSPASEQQLRRLLHNSIKRQFNFAFFCVKLLCFCMQSLCFRLFVTIFNIFYANR